MIQHAFSIHSLLLEDKVNIVLSYVWKNHDFYNYFMVNLHTHNLFNIIVFLHTLYINPIQHQNYRSDYSVWYTLEHS